MLTLQPGGRLFLTRRDAYDGKPPQPLRQAWPDELWCEPLHLDGDVRVRDLFRLMASKPEFWFKAFSHSAELLSREALRSRRKPEVATVVWQWSPIVSNPDKDDDPIGPEIEMNVDGGDEDGEPKYAIDFLSAGDVAGARMVIDPVRRILRRQGERHRTVATLRMQPSLGIVVHSLITELMWHGPPEKRDAAGAELRAIPDDAPTISHEELRRRWGLPGADAEA